MKTKLIFLGLWCFIGLLTSCTPTPINNDNKVEKTQPVYATGGEHSTEADNEKD
ncbi:hypothetical protein K8089_11975 [Aequorivita sp. F47161]|uniref:Uncharacterized protein n=1 Tax=Aequorivita vitellina TaxID=2874475 RepID=A0A9X1QYJ8_9FLAO|nr:hypothetical protein [Aequorivita vitellina]MCG2419742.1 hypothetical protein [Aequorivita vitellina]